MIDNQLSRNRSVKIFTYILLIVGCIIMILPFLWMISTSLKEGVNVYKMPPEWIPKSPKWSNYTRLFTEFEFQKYLLNSLLLSMLNIIGNVISCSLVAYAFATQEFKYKNYLFMLVLATMMLPSEVIFFPQFLLFNYIGWYGSMKPLYIPAFFGNSFFIFLLRQYFLTIPREIMNAAKIDGCSNFKIFWKIYLPLSKPALATVALYTFVGTWNDFFGPLIYITKEENRTAAVALHYLKNTYENTSSLPITMAASIITVIPTIILYYIGQRYFTKGMVFKGIK